MYESRKQPILPSRPLRAAAAYAFRGRVRPARAVTAAVLFAPLLHRVLHRFHVDEKDAR